jgi:hypothetical protein
MQQHCAPSGATAGTAFLTPFGAWTRCSGWEEGLSGGAVELGAALIATAGYSLPLGGESSVAGRPPSGVVGAEVGSP